MLAFKQELQGVLYGKKEEHIDSVGLLMGIEKSKQLLQPHQLPSVGGLTLMATRR